MLHVVGLLLTDEEHEKRSTSGKLSGELGMMEPQSDRNRPMQGAASPPLQEQSYASIKLPPRPLRSEVLHGDCHVLLGTLPAGSVDCVFIDPPYNVRPMYPNRRRTYAGRATLY